MNRGRETKKKSVMKKCDDSLPRFFLCTYEKNIVARGGGNVLKNSFCKRIKNLSQVLTLSFYKFYLLAVRIRTVFGWVKNKIDVIYPLYSVNLRSQTQTRTHMKVFWQVYLLALTNITINEP